jgi:hypothetical protein
MRFRVARPLAQSADFLATEIRMKRFLIPAAVSLFAVTAWAQAGHDHHAMPTAAKPAGTVSATTLSATSPRYPIDEGEATGTPTTI